MLGLSQTGGGGETPPSVEMAPLADAPEYIFCLCFPFQARYKLNSAPLFAGSARKLAYEYAIHRISPALQASSPLHVVGVNPDLSVEPFQIL